MIAALRQFRDRFELPFTDDQLGDVPFYRPADDSPEMKYLRDRRRTLGGCAAVPQQRVHAVARAGPQGLRGALQGHARREGAVDDAGLGRAHDASLMKDPSVGKLIVPIVPDEGQTFGMPPMYKAFGIYSGVGQLYTPGR